MTNLLQWWKNLFDVSKTKQIQTKTNNSKTSKVFPNRKLCIVNDNRTVRSKRGRKICKQVGEVAKVARRGTTKPLGNQLLVRDVHVAAL